MPEVDHVKVEMPRVVAAMSVQRILENALRFAEDVCDEGQDESTLDRREVVIGDLRILLNNVTWR